MAASTRYSRFVHNDDRDDGPFVTEEETLRGLLDCGLCYITEGAVEDFSRDERCCATDWTIVFGGE